MTNTIKYMIRQVLLRQFKKIGKNNMSSRVGTRQQIKCNHETINTVFALSMCNIQGLFWLIYFHCRLISQKTNPQSIQCMFHCRLLSVYSRMYSDI